MITDERVYLRRGLLNQKTRSVARDRIRTVDVTAHLLHRVLGVCKVSIGTGRNDLRSGESFHLDGVTPGPRPSRCGSGCCRIAPAPDRPELKLCPACQPISLQRHRGAPARVPCPRLSAAPAGGAAPAAAAERRTRGPPAPLNWLRFAPLRLRAWSCSVCCSDRDRSNATDINIAATDPVQHVVADFTDLSVVQRILAGGSVLLACYVLIAMVGYVAVFWNFRLVSLGAGTLRVTRGLLSVRATTISLARLRGVEDQRVAAAARRAAPGASRSPQGCVGRGAEGARARCSRPPREWPASRRPCSACQRTCARSLVLARRRGAAARPRARRSRRR